MKQYRLVDNIFGWVAFIIAAFTYCSTIEPTASFGTVLSLLRLLTSRRSVTHL